MARSAGSAGSAGSALFTWPNFECAVEPLISGVAGIPKNVTQATFICIPCSICTKVFYRNVLPVPPALSM